MAELNPTEKTIRAVKRRTFVVSLAVTFLLATVATWWVVPMFANHVRQVASSTGAALPAIAVGFLHLAGIFKVLYFPIATGCVLCAVFAVKGRLDPFLTLLNILTALLGGAIVLICFLAVFMPTLAMTSTMR
jgi:hypothetical protein